MLLAQAIVVFLQAAGVDEPGPIMQPISGKSLFDIFQLAASGIVNGDRNHVLVGKERHDIGRPNAGGYPIRGIRQGDWLYLQNFETDRWPAGNPETGYLNCDASPTKSLILEQRRAGEYKFWDLCFGKRPSEELFNLTDDPDCVRNLGALPEHQSERQKLKDRMTELLRSQGDPRMFGRGEIFDRYPYSSPATDNFYERYMAGEKVPAGWVNPSDFEKAPLD